MADPASGFIAGFVASNEGFNKVAFLVAGGLGSIISMQFIEGMSTKQRLCAVVTGIILADQFAMQLAEALGAGRYAFGAAGMIGLFGFSFIGAVIKGLKDSDFAAIIRDLADAVISRIMGSK